MSSTTITKAVVRMYRMGTGDCFVVKFLAGNAEKYTMMIDCGTWQGSNAHITPYIEDLKAYVNNRVDLLVITHEHKDHVHGFDICEELLTNDFEVKSIWMGWTENDKTKKVKQWQKDYGEKKKALALAAFKLKTAIADPVYKESVVQEFNGNAMMLAKESFASVVSGLDELQNNAADGVYPGGLAGMKVVKERIADSNIEYYGPGDIIENIPELNGISFYVLGPPKSIDDVSKETGGKGESYDHNKELSGSDAFAAAILSSLPGGQSAVPFEDGYVLGGTDTTVYSKAGNDWRKIDCDWLFSAGSLALRMNSLTNNLSLALAIEFNKSGKVMLFPGDAEYGSWASWHRIKWQVPSRNSKPHFTEDLLSRTVFYKVAHHLSHHGTAERLGMEMMTHPDLTSMATLDYSVISPSWKNTMPNRALIKALISQSKGRLMVMNLEDLYYDLDNTIKLSDQLKKERKKMSAAEKKAFEDAYEETDLYLQFTVTGTE